MKEAAINSAPRAQGRGRSIFAAGARTVGRSLLRTVTRSDVGAHWAKVGEDWYQTLGELKGAAMKLGQLASQYQDLLPPEFAQHLERLQADAQALDWSQIKPVLDDSWSAEQIAQLAHIDPAPIASASIGQVHTGRLLDGREVAIKIRYPGVADAMSSDVKNLGRVLRAAGVLPIDKASLDGLLTEIRDRMSEEMDYAKERDHLVEFAQLSKPGAIRIPAVIQDLCTDSVLVTEYAPGHSLETASGWPQAQRDQIGDQYVDWLLEQIFTHGLVHADPHPGNFSFRESGEIVVYDFGCVKRVSTRDKQLLARQLACVVEDDWASFHNSLEQLGALSKPEQAMTERLRDLYAANGAYFKTRLLQAPHFDFSDESFIPEARAQFRKALPHWRQFKPVPELAFVARALSGSYWLLRRLGARVDLQTKIARVTDSVLIEESSTAKRHA